MKLFAVSFLCFFALHISAADGGSTFSCNQIDKRSGTERFYSLSFSNDALSVLVTWGEQNIQAEKPYYFLYKETWAISEEQKNRIIRLHNTGKNGELCSFLSELTHDPTITVVSELLQDHTATPY